MSDNNLALVAVTFGLMAVVAYMAYVTHMSHQSVQSVQPASEVWEVQSDKQGIPERIIVRR